MGTITFWKKQAESQNGGQKSFCVDITFSPLSAQILSEALLPAILRFCLLFSERHIYQHWMITTIGRDILYTSVHFTNVVIPFQICSVVFSVIARHCWKTLGPAWYCVLRDVFQLSFLPVSQVWPPPGSWSSLTSWSWRGVKTLWLEPLRVRREWRRWRRKCGRPFKIRRV